MAADGFGPLDRRGLPVVPAQAWRCRMSKRRATKETKARFQKVNDFVDVDMRHLTPTETLVWLLLWRDTKGDTARTARAYLARRAGVAESTVSRALRGLARRGLLKCIHKGNQQRGISIYTLLRGNNGGYGK